jgi:hypothetical protein
MQGGKMSPYDGGHRVPFFIRWPGGRLESGREIDQLAAHLDVLPTLVELCGLAYDDGPLDGVSLAPLLREGKAIPPRTIVDAFLGIVMTERWRLVNGEELYDIEADPGQERDLAEEHPEVVKCLREALEDNQRKNDDLQRRYIIGAKQNPVEFTPEDWIKRGISFWQSGIINGEQGFAPILVKVARAGTYRFELRRWPEETGAPIRGALPTGGKKLDIVRASLRVQDFNKTIPVGEAMTAAVFEVELQAGPADIAASFSTKDEQQTGAYYLTVSSIR